jgi:hypothetical protein
MFCNMSTALWWRIMYTRGLILRNTNMYHANSEYVNTCITLIPWNRALLEKLIVTQLVKKFSPFVEPEGSSPCSQEPAIGHYLEPYASSPHLSTLFP